MSRLRKRENARSCDAAQLGHQGKRHSSEQQFQSGDNIPTLSTFALCIRLELGFVQSPLRGKELYQLVGGGTNRSKSGGAFLVSLAFVASTHLFSQELTRPRGCSMVATLSNRECNGMQHLLIS